MKKEVLTRTILETTVSKALHDLETDTNRAIRNLIDLALTFSNGRFQKTFFEAAQKMLRNEDSAYYQLTRDVVTGFDHETIKTFGINIGYNSCTFGARIIRENEEKHGFNIPWTIAFDLGQCGNRMEEEVIEAGIVQGMELGVYTYLIFYGDRFGRDELEIYRRHPECAFILCMPSATAEKGILDSPEIFNSPENFDSPGSSASPDSSDSPELSVSPDIAALQELHNCFVSLEAGTPELSGICACLRERKIPYSIHSFYGDAEAEEILAGTWVESILPDHPVFAIVFAKWECGKETRRKVEDYVIAVRNEQAYPLLMMDAWSDILKIDQIISDDSCFIGFSPDGTLFGASGRLEGRYSLKEMGLAEILSNTMPKKSGK